MPRSLATAIAETGAARVTDLASRLEHFYGEEITGDYPRPWTGMEYRDQHGLLRFYSDDTDLVVVGFDDRGVQSHRATFSAGFPVDALVGLLEALLVALVGEDAI